MKTIKMTIYKSFGTLHFINIDNLRITKRSFRMGDLHVRTFDLGVKEEGRHSSLWLTRILHSMRPWSS